MNQAQEDQNTPPTAPTIVYGRPVPSFYVEGVSQMVVGAPNSRLMLHSFVERTQTPDGAHEVRHIAVELVLPTAAILEIANNLINQVAQNKERIRSSIRGVAELSDKMIAAVDATET